MVELGVSSWRRLARDNEGAVLVWVGMTIPVLAVMFALSFDLGRLGGMDTELKDIADAAALAAAKALDGSDTAIQKANAAASLVVNNSKFASSGGGISSLIYAETYAGLVAGPLLSGTGPQAKKAAFVQAITSVASTPGLIPAMTGVATMTASARSTAGSQVVACAVQPLFMCLPAGGSTLAPGTMVQVKEQPGSSWGPGNFGLLDPPNASTNQKNALLKQSLASSTPDVCYVNALSPATGSQSGKVKEAINARFDIWDNNPDVNVKFPPGPNNFRGIQPTQNGGMCVKSNPLTSYGSATSQPGAMPRDTCFETNTCGGPYGNGGWQARAPTYWNTHHTTTYPGFATRFAMYMAEMGLDTEGNSTGAAPAGRPGEPEYQKMGPVCAIQRGIASGPGTWERRVIYAAMIDCAANLDWLTGNSSKSPIQYADIGEFFLTEPTEQGQEIYMEFVKRIARDDDEGKLRSVIQLYPNPRRGTRDDDN